MANLLKAIHQYYGKQPLICILAGHQRQNVLDAALRKGWQLFDSPSDMNLQKMRCLDRGILLLTEEEGRGIDSKFKVDAHVLIGAICKMIADLHQMYGRGSRQGGVL